MPTYNQLDDEAAWRAEFAAPALEELSHRLRLHWPAAEIGIRGDNEHLSGYHRSRRWIKESRFCENHSYSVSRTPGDKSGGDPNWACAMDFGGISQSDLHAVCKRLDAAVRAGRLEKITEWYGNFGGDDRVDGWDNISNRIASSDSSHLTHLHMSFDRGRANEDHSDVLAVLIGDEDDDMTPDQEAKLNALYQALIPDPPVRVQGSWTLTRPDGRTVPINPLYAAIDGVAERVEKVSRPTPAQMDIAALVAALRPELDAAAERAVRKVLGSLDTV